MNIGKRIEIARKAAKMTKTDLARRIGVSVTAVHSWEANERNITDEKLAQVREALNMDIVDSVIDELKVVQEQVTALLNL